MPRANICGVTVINKSGTRYPRSLNVKGVLRSAGRATIRGWVAREVSGPRLVGLVTTYQRLSEQCTSQMS